MADKYTEFFLNSNINIIAYECIEISHPSFTKIYRLVRNNTLGLTVGVNTYEYCPMKITPISQRDDLDQFIKIELGDLGEIIPIEIDNIFQENSFATLPTVIYNVFKSDNLVLTDPLFGPILLEIKTFTFNKNGCMFEAKAPSLNVQRVGEYYRLDRFPALKGFL